MRGSGLGAWGLGQGKLGKLLLSHLGRSRCVQHTGWRRMCGAQLCREPRLRQVALANATMVAIARAMGLGMAVAVAVAVAGLKPQRSLIMFPCVCWLYLREKSGFGTCSYQAQQCLEVVPATGLLGPLETTTHRIQHRSVPLDIVHNPLMKQFSTTPSDEATKRLTATPSDEALWQHKLGAQPRAHLVQCMGLAS
jgi:hypothetical protein